MYGFDDFILTKFFFGPFKFFEHRSNSNNSIKKEIYYSNSDKAIFILPQWMGKTYYYKLLIHKLKTKYTVVLYDLPYNLLSSDTKLTVSLFKKIVSDIKFTFNEIGKKGCKSYCIVGTSGSTPIAAIVANSDERCKKLILNLVGNDLAECIWHSENPILINIRHSLENKGVTLAKLSKHFKMISYKYNSTNLKNKDILIFLSKNDKIVPYNNGTKLLKLLNKDNIQYELVTNKFFGHYISGIKNVIFYNKIQNFLDNW